MKYKCLSIAGFDGSGGAGLQADLKTFSALGCYGMSVLTALPVQNTCGVRSCYAIPLKCVYEQMEAIFDDIMPDAIKIGMLFSDEIIHCVADILQERASDIPIILDPVMVAKSGDALLKKDAIGALKKRLLPSVSLVTPNLPEARLLIDKSCNTQELAYRFLDLGCSAVLLKGGHEISLLSNDTFLCHHGQYEILSATRIQSNNTHGTGCTLSAAIASFAAKGMPMLNACRYAKKYLHGALNAAKDESVGNGHGPVNHFYQLWKLDDMKTLEV